MRRQKDYKDIASFGSGSLISLPIGDSSPDCATAEPQNYGNILRRILASRWNSRISPSDIVYLILTKIWQRRINLQREKKRRHAQCQTVRPGSIARDVPWTIYQHSLGSRVLLQFPLLSRHLYDKQVVDGIKHRVHEPLIGIYVRIIVAS